ncbi:hypothetical protein PR202_gb16391 [Eleusine coracana subsp. coracana]|uniref:Uncharacterized protein n=1 Tax=Eleusine coracana subsp. coracana TaxID=191504 RepID=A0AAV5EY03_ELECO|nr:hypothetical protein PR202_gb16391 [Eleusine coracana subsp. coracana]
MMPLLPTPPCLVVLPTSPPPQSKTTSRADADERWDARKNATVIKAAPPVSVSGRADAVDRWDINKKKSVTSSSSSSSSSASPASSSHGSSSSTQKWNTNKKNQSTISRADSAQRWDAHKKQPRPLTKARDLDDDDRSSTGSNDVELDTPPPRKQAFYAGPGFIVSLEPGMLPMPSFMVRVA